MLTYIKKTQSNMQPVHSKSIHEVTTLNNLLGKKKRLKTQDYKCHIYLNTYL